MAAKKRKRSAGARRRKKNPSKKGHPRAHLFGAATAKKRTRALKAGRRYRYKSSGAPHTGKRMQTYQLRNKHGKKLFHVRGWRARRANGTGGLAVAAIAVAAGVATSIAASYALDMLSSSFPSLASSTAQDGVLVALAAGSAFFIANPAVLGGVATGLLLIPVAKLVYSALPSLASPNTFNPQNPSATMSGLPGLGSLHRPIGSLHRPIGSLHAPIGMLGAIPGLDDGWGMSGMRGGVRMSR